MKFILRILLNKEGILNFKHLKKDFVKKNIAQSQEAFMQLFIGTLCEAGQIGNKTLIKN